MSNVIINLGEISFDPQYSNYIELDNSKIGEYLEQLENVIDFPNKFIKSPIYLKFIDNNTNLTYNLIVSADFDELQNLNEETGLYEKYKYIIITSNGCLFEVDGCYYIVYFSLDIDEYNNIIELYINSVCVQGMEN